VSTGIQAGLRYHLWEAAIAAGATLEELQQLDQGTIFAHPFKVALLAWHGLHQEVEKHGTDASIKKPKRGR